MKRFVAAVLAVVLGAIPPALAATQSVVLEAGWNLVSIQVGGALPVADFAAALDVPDALRAAWGRDPATGAWFTWQADVPGFTGDLAALEPGRGYWVKVSDACVLSLDGAPWEGAVALRPGWNLVGFQGLAESSLENLFGADVDAVQQVWAFDAASGGSFRGYDTTATPRLRDVTSIEPGHGYWVYALRDVLLAPEPEILLVADADAAPLQDSIAYAGAEPKFAGRRIKPAGAEDAANDLNGNGILDDAWTQDAVRFPIGVDFQPVIIGNAGGGALNWSLAEDVPWISVDGPESGVVSSAKAYTYLKVDRTGLEPGTYVSSNVWVRAGGLEKRVSVFLDVATAAGDFKGYAIAERVNGKDIALGKVDLGLSLFMESDRVDETRFRAVIDRERSLLFPKDVFMDGVFYSGSDFTLATTFTMPAGDRNAPPFDTFAQPAEGADPQGHGDRDWNGDGALDNDNPFPYAIRRGVSLVGKRIDENTFSGSYSETLQGMLPNDEKILIEGTFTLSRQTFEPTRRSIYNGENAEMQIVGASGTTSIERTIEVEDAVRVQTAIVGLNLDFPRPDLLHVELVSPSGTKVVLHDGGAQVLSGHTLTDFDGEIGQGTWTLRVSWDPASGERGRFHSWTLDLGGLVTYSASGRLVDSTGTNAVAGVPWVLTGGTMVHQGTTDADGRFRVDGLTENDYRFAFPAPGIALEDPSKAAFSIEDGNVDLGDLSLRRFETAPLPFTGFPVVPTNSVPVDGSNDPLEEILFMAPDTGVPPFRMHLFGALLIAPEDAWNALSPDVRQVRIAAWREMSAVWSVNGLRRNPTTGELQPTGETFVKEIVDPEPEVGFFKFPARSISGLCIRSAIPDVLVPEGDDGFYVTVEFYKGVRSNVVAEFESDRIPFGRPALIPPGTPVLEPLVSDGRFRLENVAFIGAGAGTGELAALHGTSCGRLLEWYRDSAAFDINRWPTNSFRPLQEDTDFYVQPDTDYYRIIATDREPPDTFYDIYETAPGAHPDRYRLECTMGGYVFGEDAARASGFYLQSGHIEP